MGRWGQLCLPGKEGTVSGGGGTRPSQPSPHCHTVVGTGLAQPAGTTTPLCSSEDSRWVLCMRTQPHTLDVVSRTLVGLTGAPRQHWPGLPSSVRGTGDLTVFPKMEATTRQGGGLWPPWLQTGHCGAGSHHQRVVNPWHGHPSAHGCLAWGAGPRGPPRPGTQPQPRPEPPAPTTKPLISHHAGGRPR